MASEIRVDINSHIPSDCGPWETHYDRDFDRVHVVPGFGRKRHRLTLECWCHPCVEDDRYEVAGVIVHNVAQ